MADQDTDKNQKATPHKLQEAKKKGQVAKSADFISVLVYVVAVVYFYWHGKAAIEQEFKLAAGIFGRVGIISTHQLAPFSMEMLILSWQILAPFFSVIMLAAIISNVVQTGPVFSFHPISPDVDRINPAQGIKRLFSVKTLFEVFRNLAKLVLLLTVLYFSLKAIFPKLILLPWGTPSGHLRTLVDILSSLGLKLALVLAVIAIIDMVYMQRHFANQMKMSHKDIKDEHKNREGDPRIRSRMRQLRMEMRKKSTSVMNTAKADVLITNPTHLAIALRYEHGKMESPQVIAKGAGMLANVMRAIAYKHHIPVVQNKPLARALYRQVDHENYVPIELYADVARIIVWVFALKRSAQKGLVSS